MPIASFARAVVAALSLPILASPATASESSSFSSTRVRAETAGMRQLIADGVAGSAAFRALVSIVEQSDLVVYVRCRLFPEHELRGRLGFLSAAGGYRYAVIEVSCYQPYSAQLEILAHELQHAVEVASAPWVVDAKTFERFYAAAGELVSSSGGTKMYETCAAVERAARVRRELRQIDLGGFK
jgi:hypothetical protein